MIPLPPTVYLVVALGVATVLAGTHWKLYVDGKKSGQAQVHQRWDNERAQAQAERAEAEMKARQREQALQKLADIQRRKHREEVNRILAEHAAFIDRLQDRPDRPASAAPGTVPTPASPGPAGCTGAELYRPDAVAFARLAADADKLRADYRACKAAYDNAVKRQNAPEKPVSSDNSNN